ncbi:DUF721 domain-containing protein [Acaryochloris sp. CCMEE 5410]|uniref:DUF721 domain-containing protein n=1 Tax=Acaryochloris sp. CCMEE 5410 TaxID=310037 RepID=UPI0002484423|nr:DUF721 domain-containing protein [Acaryochloris sp. CCMEE 5410]KAI9132577.1 DUF721 domain-containing protein [Acaryochloris sp. CCMEE 5410]
MSLHPVQQVLSTLKQTHWQHEQEFVQLLDTWTQIVGPVVAAQTQPIQITPRKILLVATASSAWAQNLAFERSRILHKLNIQLSYEFTDIRFSTSQWPRRSNNTHRRSSVPPSITPASLLPALPVDRLEPSPDPNEAFERWTNAIHKRSHGYPTCPICQCPTPKTELQRWSVCSLCAVREPEV